MLENSKSRPSLTTEGIAIFFVAALVIVVVYWYFHSIQRLNDFTVDEVSMWNLNLPTPKNIVDSSRSTIAKYLKEEERLQRALYQKRTAANINWSEIANLESELGALQLSAGQFQKAEVSYSEALNVFNNHDTSASSLEIAQNWQGLGQSALANGETLKAANLSERTVQLLEKNFNVNSSENVSDLALTTAAEANFRMNKFDAAIGKYKELISKNESGDKKVPTNVFSCAQAFARCGDMTRLQKDYSASRQYYEQASADFGLALVHRDADLRNYSARCLYGLALVDQGENKWGKATRELENAIKTNADKSSAFSIILKKAYAQSLSHSNFLKGQFATVDALNALDEFEAKKG